MKFAEFNWKAAQRLFLLLLGLSFCLYLPTLFHGAFADDDVYLAYSNHLLRESNWRELYLLLVKPANPWEFLPLRDLTYWLDFRLFGDDPFGFHATNLAWYGVSSLASFWLFRELILLCRPAWVGQANAFALFGALVFVIHPAHVEAVAWIASRKDLMAGALSLLSCATLVRAMRRRWPPRDLVLAALLLLAACFSKASAMTTVLLLTVLVGGTFRAVGDGFNKRRVGALLLFWAIAILAVVVHFLVAKASGIRIPNDPGTGAVLERASRIFAALVGILVTPYPPRFYHDVYQGGSWHWFVSAALSALVLLSLIAYWTRRSLWAIGLVFALAPTVIYLQCVPFTTWSLASERFVFLPVAGLALILIDLLGRFRRPAVVGLAAILIVLPCAMIVWERVEDWGAPREAILAREYRLQPGFHNAIRDRIFFTLLPEKRFDEAETLAQSLPKQFVRDALVALIRADHSYTKLFATKDEASSEASDAAKTKFCAAYSDLQSAVDTGYVLMRDEPDISYNNIFRMLEKELESRYGSGSECPKSISGHHLKRRSGSAYLNGILAGWEIPQDADTVIGNQRVDSAETKQRGA